MIKKRLFLIIFIFEVLIGIKNCWWCHNNLFLFKVYTYFLFIFFYFPLSSWRYSFLLSFRLKFAISERHGRTCSLVSVHDKNKITISLEISYGTNNMTRKFWNSGARKHHAKGNQIFTKCFLIEGYIATRSIDTIVNFSLFQSNFYLLYLLIMLELSCILNSLPEDFL